MLMLTMFTAFVSAELCDPGFYGSMCDGVCDCKNGAACKDGSTKDSPNNGSCVCIDGFYGSDCGGQCNCLNGGDCADGSAGNGHCFCKPGFMGQNCAAHYDPPAEPTHNTNNQNSENSFLQFTSSTNSDSTSSSSHASTTTTTFDGLHHPVLVFIIILVTALMALLTMIMVFFHFKRKKISPARSVGADSIRKSSGQVRLDTRPVPTCQADFPPGQNTIAVGDQIYYRNQFEE